MREVALGRADFFQLRGIDVLHDFGFLTEGLKQRQFLGPGPHGGPLDGLVGILACHAPVGEFQQDGLAPPESESEVHVSLHVLGIDGQVAHKPGQQHQHVVKQGAGVGQDDPFRTGVTDVALVPESDVFHGGLGIAAKDASEAAEALAGDRVPLVRHGGASLLPLGKSLLHLEDFRPLEMAELGGPAVDAAADERDRRHELGMTVALDDLGGNVRGLEAEFFADVGLDLGIEMGVCSNGPADRTVCDAFPGLLQTLDGAAELVVHNGKLETEGDRLGMDAVAAADHRGEFVLLGPRGDRLQELLQVLEQDIGRLDHLDRQGGVEQVGRGESAVDPSGRLADMDGDFLEEGDHVVIRPLLDLADLVDAEGSLIADRLGILLGDDSDLGHPFAGKGLDFEPDFQFPLLRPNGAHLGAAVAIDHPETLARPPFQGSPFCRQKNGDG